jgi:hypothetical protein
MFCDFTSNRFEGRGWEGHVERWKKGRVVVVVVTVMSGGGADRNSAAIRSLPDNLNMYDGERSPPPPLALS